VNGQACRERAAQAQIDIDIDVELEVGKQLLSMA
jgi:hypothetical protein